MILYCKYEENLEPNYVEQFLRDTESLFLNPHIYPVFTVILFYVNDNRVTTNRKMVFVKSAKQNPDGSTIEYFANYKDKVKEFLTTGVKKKPLCIMIQREN